MRTITTIAGLLLLLAGALYFYYVRGVGISPQISAPAATERGGRVRTYTFSVSAGMPTPRTEVASAVLAGKIYVIGGFDGLGRTVASVEVYDPAIRLWAAGPNLPAPRHHTALVTAGNTLYALGGYTGSGFEPHAEAFALDAGAVSWRPVAPLPEARGPWPRPRWTASSSSLAGWGPRGWRTSFTCTTPWPTAGKNGGRRRRAVTTSPPPHCMAGCTWPGAGSKPCRRTWRRSRSTIRPRTPGAQDRKCPLPAAGSPAPPSTGSSSWRAGNVQARPKPRSKPSIRRRDGG